MNKKLQNILDNINYYFWDVPKNWYYDIKWYIKNLFTFNKMIWDWRPWDYSYQVNLFKFGIQQLCDCIEKYGNEETVSRMKKINAMKQLITELSRDVEEEVHNKVYGIDYDYQFYTDENGVMHSRIPKEEAKKLADTFSKEYAKERKKHFAEIFRLIEGQDSNEITKLQNEEIVKINKTKYKEEQENGFYNQWVQVFDGTGIQGWWD